MQTIKQKNGFTLLELLLVILLFSIIAVAGIATYQQYSTQAKVKTTAQQMQQILQAASAYFIDYGCWPGDSTCPSNAPSFNTYITSSTINPWGQTYTYSVVNNTKKFQVQSGNLPNTALISQVAAFLPSAVINGQQVLSQVAIPAKTKVVTANSRYTIMRMAQTLFFLRNKNYFNFQVTCPAGSTADSLASPMNIQAEGYSTCLAGDATFNNISTIGGCTLINSTTNTYQCNNTVQYISDIPVGWLACAGSTGGWNGGKGTFTYIAWCFNPNIKKQSTNTKHSFFHLF
jgi:general secretion pathway protein G